jgi:hypothetical protein
MDEGRLKMDQEKEVCRLAAESLATETLLVALLSRFAHLDAAMRATITDAFDEASQSLENRTVDAGSASPEDFVRSVRIIEQLRAATLGPREK